MVALATVALAGQLNSEKQNYNQFHKQKAKVNTEHHVFVWCHANRHR